MIRVCVAITVLLLFGNCKKVTEDIQEKRALEFITQGQWRVTGFIKDGINYTYDLYPYIFQFKKNATVDVLKNGATETTGTWSGDISSQTITANFPSNASTSLLLLNGTFFIYSGGENYVEAEKSESGHKSLLRMERI